METRVIGNLGNCNTIFISAVQEKYESNQKLLLYPKYIPMNLSESVQSDRPTSSPAMFMIAYWFIYCRGWHLDFYDLTYGVYVCACGEGLHL